MMQDTTCSEFKWLQFCSFRVPLGCQVPLGQEGRQDHRLVCVCVCQREGPVCNFSRSPPICCSVCLWAGLCVHFSFIALIDQAKQTHFTHSASGLFLLACKTCGLRALRLRLILNTLPQSRHKWDQSRFFWLYCISIISLRCRKIYSHESNSLSVWGLF